MSIDSQDDAPRANDAFAAEVPAADSTVEKIKHASDGLRGQIAAGLADPHTAAVREDDANLVKFHGIYQQDDRDLRAAREKRKLEPAHSFMIRLRIPGGRLLARQWLALDSIASELTEAGSLRLTNRQTVQFHGVPKENLRAALSACDRVALDSIAACGDVNRNVLCPPDFLSPAHESVFACARAISDKLLPATGAYREIWLGRERVDDPAGEVDPLYGRRYLPRKFKIALAIPPRNDVDVFANDLGFIAIVKNGALAGFNVAVGGGLGTTFGDARTYARLASVIGFCRPQDAPEVAWHVAALQRDYGDRTDRKVARLKYTIDRLGLDVVKRDLAARLAAFGVRLQARRSFAFDRGGDDLGWATDANGLRHVALWIEGGRIQNARKRGLREVAGLGACDFRVTPLQNLILGKIAPADEARVRATLARNGIDPDGDKATPIRQHAMACVALPTCPLAMAEAERYLPDFIGKIEAETTRRGLAKTRITVRISGCPNGCARPQLAEIALVGKSPGRYNLLLGGDARGARLARLVGENLDEAAVLRALAPIFDAYAARGDHGQSFGDFFVAHYHPPSA